MKPLSILAALPALALFALAGCQVNVDNKSKANLENAADSLGDTLGNAADAVGNAADRAGETIEKGADDIGNRVDVNVNLHGDDKPDGNASGNASASH